VVVTDVGGHPELVAEELGRLVPSEDPSAFDRAGIAARTRERYSVERVGGELAAVYAAARSRDRNTKRL
jgi:glycosyltransferase involved in cell wall biosynthesis